MKLNIFEVIKKMMIFHSLIGCCTAYGSGYFHLFLSHYCVLPKPFFYKPKSGNRSFGGQNLEKNLSVRIWASFDNWMQFFFIKSLLCISSNHKFLNVFCWWAIYAFLDYWFRILIRNQSNSGFGTKNPVQNCLKENKN